MLKSLSRTLSKENLSNAQVGWDDVITDAEQEMEAATERARKLKGVIRQLRELKAEGARFPVADLGESGNVPSPTIDVAALS